MNFKILILMASVILSFTSLMFAQSVSQVVGAAGALSSAASAVTSISSGGTSSQGSTAINKVLCNVYSTIMDVVFVLAIVLMVGGGALYAASRILPGNLKGQLEGYAYGMLLGGVVGIILVILGPDIIKMIVGNTSSGISTTTVCNGTPI
ncbi:hypothetical protein M1141_03625 [Candidatus Marsarchaeota archaeon]|nr:hypothetical protein [Candidatus Marsarchaeota archaeon]